MAGCAWLKLGGLPTPSFKATSDTKIQAITPPGAPGPAAIVVQTSDGSTATSPTPYTYS